MKSQIEVERVFNIAIICMNLHHLGWAQRILKCLLASTKTNLMMLGLRILHPCKIHGDGGNTNGRVMQQRYHCITWRLGGE